MSFPKPGQRQPGAGDRHAPSAPPGVSYRWISSRPPIPDGPVRRYLNRPDAAIAATVICPDRPAKPVRVIGQGDQERRAPLPEKFGQVFSFWRKDPPRGESLFARAPGQQPVSSPAARADRRGIVKQAGIEKKISPHNLRPTDATHRLNAGAERVDIQAPLGHSTINTTQD